MKPNVELLERTLEYVIAHPDEHDQNTWRSVLSCGTTMCFAGHAATLAGGSWVTIEDHWYGLIPEADDEYQWAYHGVPYVLVRKRAQRVLGLTDEQANALFLRADDLAKVKEVVHAIITGGPLPDFDREDEE